MTVIPFGSDVLICQKSFADVTITEAGVDTVEFLKAAEGVVGIFGMFTYLCHKIAHRSESMIGILNTPLLSPVSNDLGGNILVSPHISIPIIMQSKYLNYCQKIRRRHDQTPEKSDTLENLVRNEMAEKRKEATQGLLWLIRGLSFTCKAIQQTQADPAKQLSTAFNESYADTLKPYHSFIVRPIFSVSSVLLQQRGRYP